MRGDGRPDFRYRAHFLYGDSVTPSRIPVQGGTPISLQGMGFKPNMTVTVGGQNAALLAVSANRIMAQPPFLTDGEQSVVITDAGSGSSTTLQNSLVYGAGPNDAIRLTQGSNPPTPVGGEAPNAVRVLVTTPDGTTPVSGATVQWTASNAATPTACTGATSCLVLTDESGKAETRVRVGATAPHPSRPRWRRHRIPPQNSCGQRSAERRPSRIFPSFLRKHGSPREQPSMCP
jgi:IPT/TIG domain